MRYLAPTYFFDYTSQPIRELVAEFREGSRSEKEMAVGLYTRVRDNWKYDPYRISLEKADFRASRIAGQASGNCVEKSILLIAGLRALGIPARLHLGKVKNHLAAERLKEKFGSDELTPHGMVNACIDGKWLKMSPAFNRELCEKFDVEPLEFDGENDSYLQAFDSEGRLFMEYLEDYGHFEDVPLDFMINNLKAHYPHIFDTDKNKSVYRL
ncbi:transglutaminase-like domain-containing protein [Robiginitalea biformata]|uniref:Transglutaminase-like domain-containing protein n=1 Tax=Robiginitalea biformata (strain ATCC BAA-864 / DSM 15991 / KCTC 12146 / HTCC2501) TaxID=313596 RepID=A4CN06_ROBBH|nr:transglutaminase family protein [Robiginitalea biformata]EAR15048.1 hypothetical protein RB2501_11997 [Robiginitalea biformata HTCC2501]